MSQSVEYLTAETERGRKAIETVMRQSYQAGFSELPPQWAIVRVVDSVPVSFILVDPDHKMDFPGGQVRYAFVSDVATREDRRREGHFRAIMDHTFEHLRADGYSLVILHGRYQLYRRLGFEVFTYHSGIFITPEAIERRLGTMDLEAAHGLVRIMKGPDDLDDPTRLLIAGDAPVFFPDLLVVPRVYAQTLPECRMALQAAAAVAREQGKTRILFEHPYAPSYGSHYPIYPSPETPLAMLARACGGQVIVQGADPEGGAIPDADWIKVLDAAVFVQDALRVTGRCKAENDVPPGVICLDTDAGAVTIESLGSELRVSAGIAPGVKAIRCPSTALAQWITGYLSADVLATIHNLSLSTEELALLQSLFAPLWRFSWNESWLVPGP